MTENLDIRELQKIAADHHERLKLVEDKVKGFMMASDDHNERLKVLEDYNGFQDLRKRVKTLEEMLKRKRIRPSQENQTCPHLYEDLTILAGKTDLTIDVMCNRCGDKWLQGIMRITLHHDK